MTHTLENYAWHPEASIYGQDAPRLSLTVVLLDFSLLKYIKTLSKHKGCITRISIKKWEDRLGHFLNLNICSPQNKTPKSEYHSTFLLIMHGSER